MIFHIGAFPPPISGLSVANDSLKDLLLAEGMQIEVINTSPKNLNRDIFSRISRFRSIIFAWLRVLSGRRHRDQLYIAISGGWGQFYDIITIIIARYKKLHCIIHHHSYSYLTNKNPVTAVLILISGQDTTHIVLCNHMKKILKSHYRVNKVVTLTNLVLFSGASSKPILRDSLRTIGFISNITKEKGGDIVVLLAYAIKELSLPINMIVAGPCIDAAITAKLQQAVADQVLEWRGGLYGAEKQKFFQEIDALIFPTQFVNEAEPIVIWEALISEVPVISYNRGCIKEQLKDAGIIINPEDDFVAKASTVLRDWYTDVNKYQSYVNKTRFRVVSMQAQLNMQWYDFLNAVDLGRRNRY